MKVLSMKKYALVVMMVVCGNQVQAGRELEDAINRSSAAEFRFTINQNPDRLTDVPEYRARLLELSQRHVERLYKKLEKKKQINISNLEASGGFLILTSFMAYYAHSLMNMDATQFLRDLMTDDPDIKLELVKANCFTEIVFNFMRGGAVLGTVSFGFLSLQTLYRGIHYRRYLKSCLKNQLEIQKIIMSYEIVI